MRDGTLHFNDRLSWPITPFVGTLGVAPDREVTTSLDGQGEWGGNLDIRDVRPGNRILLPIFHPGGLFYLGDVHASQGDTEFTGTAAETTAVVRLRLDLIKGKRPPWMRIEKPDSIVAVYAIAAAGGRGRDGDDPPDGLAHQRLRLHADGRLLPGQHLPGFSHQRLSDVQDRQTELRGRSGNAEAVSTCLMLPPGQGL